MPPLTSSQKATLTQFMSITGVPERNATKLLKASGWKLELACESFMTEGARGRHSLYNEILSISTIKSIAMGGDPIRAAFEIQPNIILPMRSVHGVRVDATLNHYKHSVRAANCVKLGSHVLRRPTHHIGYITDLKGIQTISLLDTPSSLPWRPKGTLKTQPPHMAFRYIIAPSPPDTPSVQLLDMFGVTLGSCNPPRPYTPTTTARAGQHPSRNLRSKLRYCGQYFVPTEESCEKEYQNPVDAQILNHSIEQRLERLPTATPTSLSVAKAPSSSDLPKAPFKLDPTRMFEMRASRAKLLAASASRPNFWRSRHRIGGMELDDFFRLCKCGEGRTNLYSSYFGSNGTVPMAKEKDSLGKLFEKYRDPKNDGTDLVSVDGTMEYLQELGVNMETTEFLVPLEIIQAPVLGEMTKDGFVDGWKNIDGVVPDTISKQKAYVASQIKLMRTDMALFKRVYRHAFIIAKDKGQKALVLGTALIYWKTLFGPSGKPWITSSTNFIDIWLEYLEARWTKTVNKDMWNQTFEFFQKSLQDESLSFWSEDSAWPGVIDEFVAYIKAKRGDITESMETD